MPNLTSDRGMRGTPVPYPNEGSAKLKSVADKPKGLTKEEWSAIALRALADNRVAQAVHRGATAYHPEQYNAPVEPYLAESIEPYPPSTSGVGGIWGSRKVPSSVLRALSRGLH